MEDSVHITKERDINTSHSNKPGGRLHKGSEYMATNATIPSKYQTMVISESDKKGFLMKAKRFRDITNDIPGPGKYMSHCEFESNSTSYSKKGTGGMASVSKRKLGLSNYHNGGSYVVLPSAFDNHHDFNRSGNTRNFQKMIADTPDPIPMPAPNQYQICLRPQNKMCAEAAFRSQTKRELMNWQEASKRPAPCQYSVNYSLVEGSPKAVSGPFKSKSSRRYTAEPSPFPGPGTYTPSSNAESKDRPKQLRKHYLCLSAPALQLPPQPTQPGPGTYDLPSDFEEKPKHYMSSSSFVSTTGRWTSACPNIKGPGPASYHLAQPLKKQSFLLNVDRKWI